MNLVDRIMTKDHTASYELVLRKGDKFAVVVNFRQNGRVATIYLDTIIIAIMNGSEVIVSQKSWKDGVSLFFE